MKDAEKDTELQAYALDWRSGSAVPGGLELLNDRALASGKRIRPALLFRVADCLGVPREKALPYAVAAERIHNATLLHDDVIDEAHTRRGRPTLNAGGENRRAILAGDLLLARTLSELATANDFASLRELFDVLVDLTEGEWLQLEARGSLDVEERHLREVSRKKTASLFSWCMAAPARIAGLSSDTLQRLRQCGIHLGVAFQLWDDCEDFNAKSGKPFGQDLREGQVNFVIQNLMRRAPEFRPVIEGALWKGLELPLKPRLLEELERSREEIRKSSQLELMAARAAIQSSGLAESAKITLERRVLAPLGEWLSTSDMKSWQTEEKESDFPSTERDVVHPTLHPSVR